MGFLLDKVGFVGDHGALSGLGDDDHLQYLLLLGRAGGQDAIGGTGVGDELSLQGSSDAGLGTIRLKSPVQIDDISAGADIAVTYNPTFTTGGGLIGGMLYNAPTLTVDNSLFIWSMLQDQSLIKQAVNPGFAVFTLLNEGAVIRNEGNFNLVNVSVLFAAVQHHRITPGTSLVTTVTGMSFFPMSKTTVSGAILTRTNLTAIDLAPLWSTVAGSTVNLGTIRGIHCKSPAVGFLQPSAGVENMTAYYGIDFGNITLSSGAVKAAVRSVLVEATNAYFLKNDSTAKSKMGIDDSKTFWGTGLDASFHYDGTDFICIPDENISGGEFRVEGKLHVQSNVFPPLLLERLTASTNLINSGFQFMATTSGDMTDGFGSAQFWTIQDDAAVKNNIASVYAERAGADNTGKWTLNVYSAGTPVDVFDATSILINLLPSGGTIVSGADVKIVDTKFLILDKPSGNGIKVDTTTPTFPWRDLLGNLTAQNQGASKPTFTAYRGGILQYQFGVGDEEFFEFHIPHDYVKGTDIFFHVHWSHTSVSVTGGTVTFEVESSYSKGHDQAPFQAPVTGTFVGNASAVQYQHIISEVQYSDPAPAGLELDTDDLEPDGVIMMRVELNANNMTGATPDPFIHYVDIHYQSTNIGTKEKAPDFYA